MSDNLDVISDLGEFFKVIFKGEEGFVYLAVKEPSTEAFTQHFFQWPIQEAKVLSFIHDKTDSAEVYFAPALFKDQSSKKESIIGARVLWCEFDGNAPKNVIEEDITPPSLRLQSSIDGHEHWYWELDSLTEVETLEAYNKALTYRLEADNSGWDANQILRPLGTLNHKRNKRVILLDHSGKVYAREEFDKFVPEVDESELIKLPDSLPTIEEALAKYTLPYSTLTLFKSGVEKGKRSEGLMALGYSLAELQIDAECFFTILADADSRWGKFANRSDREVRLREIITLARKKHPLIREITPNYDVLEPMGYQSLLQAKFKLEWVWTGFLQKAGYMLLSGPSGVGKTQFSLSAAAHMVLGKQFLDLSTDTIPQKIGFFSLEMGPIDLKYFLMQQAKIFTPDEMQLLQERLIFYPLGEPLYMNTEKGQQFVEQEIEKHGFTGLMIDSLGSATSGSLSEETSVKPLMDWNDRLRSEYQIFSWFIHHHRKANGDNSKPNKLSDVFGSQYITARTTSSLALWPTKESSVLQLIPLKVRLSPKDKPMAVYRTSNLHYVKQLSSSHGSLDKKNLNPEEIMNKLSGTKKLFSAASDI